MNDLQLHARREVCRAAAAILRQSLAVRDLWSYSPPAQREALHEECVRLIQEMERRGKGLIGRNPY